MVIGNVLCCDKYNVKSSFEFLKSGKESIFSKFTMENQKNIYTVFQNHQEPSIPHYVFFYGILKCVKTEPDCNENMMSVNSQMRWQYQKYSSIPLNLTDIITSHSGAGFSSTPEICLITGPTKICCIRSWWV